MYICTCVCLAIYETLSAYNMNSDPRGRCLIINIRSFDKAEVPLNPRPGSETDAGQCALYTFYHVILWHCSVHTDNTVMFISCAMLPSVLFSYYKPTTHTHLFNGPLSGTTRVSRYQKGKTNLDFTEARDSEWQWHQLDHLHTICTSLQTDNHASTPPLSFLQAGCPSCPQPTASKH